MTRRYSLHPPVDVEGIARKLADVSEKRFPTDIDGLCLDLKVPGKRPKIWISARLHHVRRRFTLAHEIGHLIIPWHTGSIVDDLEAPRVAKGRYKIMEAEANRFAAELLMPHEWVLSLADRCDHISKLFRTVHEVADVSFDAALFRTMKYGKPGFMVAEVSDGIITKTMKTRRTRTYAPEVGTQISHVDLPTADTPAVIPHNNMRYFFWQVDGDVEAGLSPSTPWRTILDDILTIAPEEERAKTLQRINAIVGYAIGQLPKGSPVDAIYGRVLASTRNRTDDDPWLREAINHKRFNEYLLARCYERANLSFKPESAA